MGVDRRQEPAVHRAGSGTAAAQLRRVRTPRGDRAPAVLTFEADEPLQAGDGPGVIGRLQRICRAAQRELPGCGVGVSVVSAAGHLVDVAASTRRTARVEELQFTVGEGPCLAAFGLRHPVLVPNLSETPTMWPGFGPAAHADGVRAVFAFPLQVGIARLGGLTVYRAEPGMLSASELALALTYADVAMQMILDAVEGVAATAALLVEESTSLEVYQAQGVAMTQLGVGGAEALSRMRAHAYIDGRRLTDVANDILGRRLKLQPDKPNSQRMLHQRFSRVLPETS